MPDATHDDAFTAAAIAWSRDGRDDAALRLLRSSRSGIAHDIAAAYAALSIRYGSVRETLARMRLALPANHRDDVLAFLRMLDHLRERGSGTATDADLARDVDAAFPRSEVARTFADPHRANGVKPRLLLKPAAKAEPSQPVRARQQHFSASSLNMYADCRRRWYFRYVCSAVEDKGSSASYYGTAFHAALERFHQEFAHPEPTDESAYRSCIRDLIAEAFGVRSHLFGTKVEYVLQVRRAQRTAQQYVTWLIEKARRAPFTVVGCELPADLVVEGFDFIGYIDRVDRDDATGAVSVVDYKTGSIAKSAEEYRAKVLTFRDFQLPFYYWAREALGDRVTTLALIPLKDALLAIRPVELEVVAASAQGRGRDAPTVTIAVADLERARVKMGDICRALSSGAIRHFEATTDPAACTYCAYATACTERPAPGPDAFGR